MIINRNTLAHPAYFQYPPAGEKIDENNNRSGEVSGNTTGSYFTAVMSLRTILDTATAPGKPQIVNPLMSLALIGPIETSLDACVTPQRDLGFSDILDYNPESRAQHILDVLGSEGTLSKDRTVEIFSRQNEGHQSNSIADVVGAFGRGDIDHDEKLSRKELASIIRFFEENFTDDNPTPKLPDKWA